MAVQVLSIAEVLLVLGQDWAKRHRKAVRSRTRGEELTEEEDSAYHDHPFSFACQRIQESAGIDRDVLWQASISRFAGSEKIIATLSACDTEGRSAAVVSDLFAEWPELMARLFPGIRGPGPKQPGKRQRVSAAEANIRARNVLKVKLPKGKRWSVRKLAKAIGCSDGMVPKLPAWQAYAEENGLSRRDPRPKGASLTQAVLAKAGTDDAALKRLIAEHTQDFEESPLVGPSRRIVKCHKDV